MTNTVRFIHSKVCLMLLLAFFGLSAHADAPKAHWLWCDDSANPPDHCFLRLDFQIDEPVKRAYFYSFWDKKGTFHINGSPFSPTPWPAIQYNRGHVKGKGGDITGLLRQGRNVIAVELESWKQTARGIILKGEVELASGRIIRLVSSRAMFKAIEKAADGWNGVDFDDSAWPPATEIADVQEYPWYRYGEVPSIYCSQDELEWLRAQNNKGFPLERLLSEPERPDIRVAYRGALPMVSINGHEEPFFAMGNMDVLAREKMEDNIAAQFKAGMNFVTLYVTPERYCRPDETYDLAGVDTDVRRILARCPNAHFIIEFRRDRPADWKCLKDGDDEAVGYAAPAIPGGHPANSHIRVPSFASQKYRDEIATHLMRIGEQCLKQPWGRRIAVILFADGFSADGMPWGCHVMPDNGRRMTEAFRRFLSAKYRTDEALRKSWADDGVSLATATVPDKQQRWGSRLFLRNAGDPRDRRVIDYYECYHAQFTDFMLEFGRNAKRAFPGRLTASYYGYMFLPYTPEGSTANIEPLLKSPDIDILYSTSQGYNLTDGLHRQLNSALRRHGKFASMEADIRTHLGKDFALVEPQWRCNSPEETRATISKVIANALFNGSGFHTSDIGRPLCLFNCPEVLESVEAGRRIWQRFTKQETLESASDIAVVINPRDIWLNGHPDNGRNYYLSRALLAATMPALNFSGYSNDLLDIDGLLASSHNYKTVVFLNCFGIPMEKRTRLRDYLRRPGMTSIWCVAPGLCTPEGFSAKAMSDLIGLQLEYTTEPSLFTIRTSLADAADVPATLVPMYMEKMKYAPRVHCTDTAATPLAYFADGGQVAIASRRFPDGSQSIFTGTPINNIHLWARLLRDTGSHAFTPPGFMAREDSRLLMVFSMPHGTWPPECPQIGMPDDKARENVTVRLRPEWKGASLRELFTGQILKADGDSLSLQTTQPKVWLLCPNDKSK